MRWTPPWHFLQWWRNRPSSRRESQIWSCPSSMGGWAAEPQSDEQKKKGIKERIDTRLLRSPPLSGWCQSTCPTNILPATLKVSVGEVPIVICISHEICTGHNTHGPSSQTGALRENVLFPTFYFYLQNEPLHYPQKVKDGHDAAEEHHDGQSLRKERKTLSHNVQWQQRWAVLNGSSSYLKGENVFDQVPEHKGRAFVGVLQEHLWVRHREEPASSHPMVRFPAGWGKCFFVFDSWAQTLRLQLSRDSRPSGR